MAARTAIRVLRALPAAVAFAWTATRGARLRPWRSPYLRWRVETYSGLHAETIRPSDMARLFWAEKAQIVRFLLWLGDMRGKVRPSV